MLSFRLPAAFFRTQRINASGLTCQLSWLEPASRSGLSLSRNDCPFPGHHFVVKAPDLLLRRPAVHSPDSFGFRFPHAPRFAPARARSIPKSRCPTPARHSQPFLGSPLPFGAFRTLKDQSVQPDSWPESSPSKRSRLPITPRHRVYFISSIPDHRSRPAKRLVVCCSSDLLEPLLSCTFCHVTVKLKLGFGAVFLCFYFYLFHILSGKHGCTTCGKNVILGFCCWIPKASITIACRKHSSAVLGLLGRSQPWISGNAGTALGMRLARRASASPVTGVDCGLRYLIEVVAQNFHAEIAEDTPRFTRGRRVRRGRVGRFSFCCSTPS